MDLSVSPDIDAYLCYLLVLFLGICTALAQVSRKLKSFPGKWIMLNTWLLFAAYTAIPVALFWFLDRTSATHDTSLFAAILVGVGYQQILSTGLASISTPTDATKLWQPFDAWVNSIASRIGDRVIVNRTLFDEKMITNLVRDQSRIDSLRDIVMAHIADVVKLEGDLQAIDALQPVINDQGVRYKKAVLLYTSLRNTCPQTFQFLLRKSKLTPAGFYYWYAREGRSKVAAGCIAAVLIAGGIYGGLHAPKERSNYFVWRLQKANTTPQDHYRAELWLHQSISTSSGSPYLALAGALKSPMLDPKVADTILAILLDTRQRTADIMPQLQDLLIDALHNTNSDIRSRIQKVLVYLADEQSLPITPDLKAWQSDPKNSASDIDTLVRKWQMLWNAPKVTSTETTPHAESR